MNAGNLVDDIFSRTGPWNKGLAGNVRRITVRQLHEIRRLIGKDDEGGAVCSDGPGVLIWAPAGRDKYIITEDVCDDLHTIARVSTVASGGSGLLF